MKIDQGELVMASAMLAMFALALGAMTALGFIHWA